MVIIVLTWFVFLFQVNINLLTIFNNCEKFLKHLAIYLLMVDSRCVSIHAVIHNYILWYEPRGYMQAGNTWSATQSAYKQNKHGQWVRWKHMLYERFLSSLILLDILLEIKHNFIRLVFVVVTSCFCGSNDPSRLEFLISI